MTRRQEILEQLIELDEVLPEIEMGCVPDKPFGTVSVLSKSIIDGELIVFLEGESKPVNVGAVDFGRDLPPHPDFEQWEIEGMCQAGGCERCNPDLARGWDEYDRWEDEERQSEVEDNDRIAELESRVRNLEWQLRVIKKMAEGTVQYGTFNG